MTVSIEENGVMVDWDLPKLKKEIEKASDKIVEQTTDVAKPVLKHLAEMGIDPQIL